MSNPMRTKGDLLKYLDDRASEYCRISKASLARSIHMNNLKKSEVAKIHQDVIEAIIVDFVNFIGSQQGLDYGLYTKHLKSTDVPVHEPG